MVRYVVFALVAAMTAASAVVPRVAVSAGDAGTSSLRYASAVRADDASTDKASDTDAEGSNAQSEDDEADEAQAAFPKKQPSHTPWERALALPGYVIYLPFWAVFTVTGASIKFVEKTGITDQLKDIVTFNGGRGGIYPGYSGRSGAGVTFFLKDTFNEDFRFDVTASYGFLDRSLFRVRYRRLQLFNGALITGLNAQYRNMPDELFFGIGPDASKKPKTNYRRTLASGELTLGRRLGEDLDVNLVGDIEHNAIYDGRNSRYVSTLEEFPGLPGADDEITLAGVGLRAVYDGRNNEFRPSSGSLGILEGSVNEDVDRDVFGYTAVFAEYRQFVHLFYDRVLMLRLNGWFTDPLPDREIPFYKLPTHGHEATVRGYSRDRWRDQDAVLASIEYRWPIWRVIDALLFTDASHVAPSIFDDFDASKIQYSYGGGFRLYSQGDTDTWLLFAKSDDGFFVHFRLN